MGQALASYFVKKNYEVTGIARKNANINIDITSDNSVLEILNQNNYDVIINTVAIVNHKLCEDDIGFAYKVNSHPASIIAEHSKKTGAYFIQISTDHYYSGDNNLLHKETDTIKLLNEYARTKYCAEIFTLLNAGSLVVRTNIVGFRNGDAPTFVEWIINNLQNNIQMALFNDYYTSSIHVKQFAEILGDIIIKKPSGILNIAARECFSKELFIRTIADKLGLSLKNSNTDSVFNSGLVVRAESLGLDVSKAEKIIGYKFPVLNEVIESLCNEYNGNYR